MPISKEFSLVLLVAVLIGLEYMFVSYFYTMASRIKTFRRRFMREFDEIHKQAFGVEKAPDLGYPDTGNGWYSQQLSYKEWYEFNNAQRIQMNFLEHMPIVLLFAVIGGLFFPMAIFYGEIAYFVGRLLYSAGYYRGPNKRLIGALVLDFALLAMMGFAFYGSVKSSKLF